MRVGFDARWLGDSGVGNYVFGLVQALAAINDGLEIILYEDPKNPIEQLHGQHIRKVQIKAARYSIQEQFELAHRCKADHLDVFHAPFYVVPWFAPCPVVVTVHDLIPFLFDVYNFPKRHLIRIGYRLAVKKATQVIADSENTREDLIRILGVSSAKIKVVHLATSHERFSSNSAADERKKLMERYGIRQPYVFTLSAKNWKTKNLSKVLEAIKICQAEVGSVFQTVIAGSSDGFREASRQGMTQIENVVLTGFVPPEELPKLYRGADVFVMGSKYEGFGLPLLEAMNCGCPVVCSNGGSLAEVAAEGAILVDPDDAQQMGKAIANLLRNPRERELLAERAKLRAADFSWQKAARQTLSVYAEAAAKKA
jgi:glycosyltransferase involved in cell wall biosynthesis